MNLPNSAEAFAVSTGVVALGEMGDKTQLLALLLAARYRRPVPIISGIFVATLLNHALAAALGAWLAQMASPAIMRWALGLSFVAVALWMLVPDSADEVPGSERGRLGVFGITALAFFLAEMGDKTQIATVMLAAKYQSLWWVTAGTTLGMLAANVPAVLFGDKVLSRVPVRWVQVIAAAVFAALGLWVLLGGGG
jgi:Ca2+/H+ antiporter, TMEM165/GDT1 family